MDNILKLLVGVLGIAGLLAMLTPSQLATPQPEVVAAPVVTETAPNEPEEQNADDQPVSEPAVPFKFGEPMIDGRPIGDPGSAPQQNNNPDMPSEPAPGGNNDFAMPAPQNLGIPAYQYAPQPVGGNEMPTAQQN